MHSTVLRGSDFEIVHHGKPISHHSFFRELTVHHRVGVMAPHRVDAVGAVNLILAHVTAFYDRYRQAHDEFFAYPDYFVFQGEEPLASYTMIDIWPEHKSVATRGDHVERLNAINDRAINILLVTEGDAVEREYEKPQMESARRNIKQCYAYAMTGRSRSADITIRCKKDPLYGWGLTVFDSLLRNGDESMRACRADWENLYADGDVLEQAYRRVDLEEALTLL